MPVLPYLSVLEVRGTDALDFLHRQLSADIATLGDGDATFACLCQPKGRVIAPLLVQATVDGALLVCARELAATVSRRLAMYVLRDDVTIRERPDLDVHGSTAGSGAGVLCPLPKLAYRLGGEEETAADDPQSWKARELEHGVCWLGTATSEQFLPQMLGFETIGALSFRKGCYPGQEVIARTRYLGKLKRHAIQVVVAGAVTPDPMEAVEIQGADVQAAAVVVDHAPAPGGATRLFLVARVAETFEPVALVWRGQGLARATT